MLKRNVHLVLHYVDSLCIPTWGDEKLPIAAFQYTWSKHSLDGSQAVNLETCTCIHHLRLQCHFRRFVPCVYNNFSVPVILSTTLFGAGPIPKTVWLPGAICVLPAS